MSDSPHQVPRRIFVIWLGPERMSANRKSALECLESRAGVPLEFVSENDIAKWEHPNRPISRYFSFLTTIDQSDYLRAYLMALHGGGYSDIKCTSGSWIQAFDEFRCMSVDVVAYRLGHPSLAASFGVHPRRRLRSIFRPALWRHIRYRMRYPTLMGPSAFIIRPFSRFAVRYLDDIESAIDARADELVAFQASHSGGKWPIGHETYNQSLAGYPFTWGSLCMDIHQPLCVALPESIRFALPSPIVSGYR